MSDQPTDPPWPGQPGQPGQPGEFRFDIRLQGRQETVFFEV